MQIFKEALDECQVDDGLQMGEVLFFLGVSFKQLGQGDYALRCWEDSAFARDRSEAIAQRDWRVFHSIQMSRYVSRKATDQFDTLAECDMVHDLIRMTWYEIYDLDGLQQMSYYQRVAYYRSIHITFPAIGSKQVGQRGEQAGQIVPFLKSDS